MPNLDINTAVQTAFFITLAGVLVSVVLGIRTIRAGQRLMYFRKRRNLVMRGWRFLFFGLILVGVAFFFNRYAEPVIYTVFPPSPTVTMTPTVTETPTITPTFTITPTRTITPTLSITPTPFIPTEIYLTFTSVVTPSNAAVFSRPQIAREINKDRLAVNPAREFANPVGKLYGAFSYDKMTDKAQWTALWVRVADQVVICSETLPWNGGTGGYGYTECNPPADRWLPGDYEVSIFVGVTYKVSTYFSVTGVPPTAQPSATASATPSITPTGTGTRTPTPTFTPSNTATPFPPTWTPRLTDTRWPSQTPTP